MKEQVRWLPLRLQNLDSSTGKWLPTLPYLGIAKSLLMLTSSTSTQSLALSDQPNLVWHLSQLDTLLFTAALPLWSLHSLPLPWMSVNHRLPVTRPFSNTSDVQLWLRSDLRWTYRYICFLDSHFIYLTCIWNWFLGGTWELCAKDSTSLTLAKGVNHSPLLKRLSLTILIS